MVFKRLQLEVNILPMLKQVAENWDDFYLNTYRQKNNVVQKETMHIRLREAVVIPMPKGINPACHYLTNWRKRNDDSHETTNTKLYNKYTECVYFLNWFKKMYGGKIHRVMLVQLRSGGKVYPHIDEGKYYENKDRFHLGLSGYYDYTVNDETQRFGAGDLFWFDNKKMHSSVNVTPIPRISLIFDVEGYTI